MVDWDGDNDNDGLEEADFVEIDEDFEDFEDFDDDDDDDDFDDEDFDDDDPITTLN